MDSLAVLGRGLCLLPKPPAAAARKDGLSVCYSISLGSNLAAFQPSPFLALSRSPSRGRLRVRKPGTRTTRIFLPHLVAAMEEVEETYIMVKPDGVQRGLVYALQLSFQLG